MLHSPPVHHCRLGPIVSEGKELHLLTTGAHPSVTECSDVIPRLHVSVRSLIPRLSLYCLCLESFIPRLSLYCLCLESLIPRLPLTVRSLIPRLTLTVGSLIPRLTNHGDNYCFSSETGQLVSLSWHSVFFRRVTDYS